MDINYGAKRRVKSFACLFIEVEENDGSYFNINGNVKRN